MRPGSIQRGTVKALIVALFALLYPSAAQAQGTIVPFITQQFYDSNGDPCSACMLYTYSAGTSTALATYSDVTLTTANANPVVMNAAGRPSTGYIFLSATSYKFEFQSAAGVVLWTVDNASAIPTTATALDVTGTAGEALSAGDAAYLSDGSGALNAGRWYKTDSDNTYSSSTAGMAGVATTAIASGASGSIRLSGRVTGLSGLVAGSRYFASATAGGLTATPPTNARFLGSAESTTVLVLQGNPGAVRLPDSVGDLALVLRTSENLSADRTLTFAPSDGARTITVPGDVTLRLSLPAEGRLTATSGTPVTTGDVTAATEIYYTPYVGNRIALYDGSATWTTLAFGELGVSVVGCTASRGYDVFLYDNSGNVAAETLVWTSGTVRATALAYQDGVLVKSGTTTRRYVGSFYCNATGGQTDDSYATRNVYNYYNRVARPMRVLETTDTWTYTMNTYHQANAATTNQLEMMIGVNEEAIEANVIVWASNDNANIDRFISIGEDSTTTPITGTFGQFMDTNTSAAGAIVGLTASFRGFPASVGRHIYVWLEKSSETGTTTWRGDRGAATETQAGMWGTVRQ